MPFTDESAIYYARYARRYSPAVVDRLATWLNVGRGDLVLDLGCGSGQLSLPLSSRVRHILGMDAAADMLTLARAAAAEKEITRLSWLLGAERDLMNLPDLLGEHSVAAGTARTPRGLKAPSQGFTAARRLLVPNGCVAVVAHGFPLWLQDSAWSRALLRFLTEALGASLGQPSPCGTDGASRERYREQLQAAGYRTREEQLSYADDIKFDEVAGRVYAAMPADALPHTTERPAFEAAMYAALRTVQPEGPFREDVRVSALIGQVQDAASRSVRGSRVG